MLSCCFEAFVFVLHDANDRDEHDPRNDPRSLIRSVFAVNLAINRRMSNGLKIM